MSDLSSRHLILLADDSEDDRFFIKRTLSRLPQISICAEVTDGNEAIDYLSGNGDYGDRDRFPFPDLVLMDLKMPRLNGYEVLQWLRDPPLKYVPVIVVSNSSLPEDQIKCKQLGAVGYCSKGFSEKEKNRLIKQVRQLL